MLCYDDFLYIRAEDFRYETWKCRNCSQLNALPADNKDECARCKESCFKCCDFHRGDVPYVKNDRCVKCGKNISFTRKECGTPSKFWREERELYKKVSHLDMPSNVIPDHVAPLLKSDIERFMYKQAKRAVQICLDNNIWDNDFQNPKELKKDLEDIGSKNTRALNKAHHLEFLDEILWNACMSLDIRIDIGDMLRNMEEIDSSLRFYEEQKEGHLAKIEAIQSDPLSVEVKGSKGARYKVNYDQNVCTCPAFQYGQGSLCKHLKKRRRK